MFIMKKLFTLLVAALCTMITWAYDFEVDGIYYNILDENNVEVTFQGENFFRSEKYTDSLKIPESVTHDTTIYRVSQIDDFAFFECDSLYKIELPNSIQYIGPGAFSYCFDLTFIKLPEGITTIKWGTFQGCFSLRSIYLPESVTSIEEGAFFNCYALEEINFPKNLTNLSNWAFSGCTSLGFVPDEIMNQYPKAFEKFKRGNRRRTADGKGRLYF
jgi:hypothetical protein